MNISLEEMSTRMMEALLANPHILEADDVRHWDGLHIAKGLQRALAETAIELAITMNDAIVDHQNVKAMEAMKHVGLQQCTGTATVGKPE